MPSSVQAGVGNANFLGILLTKDRLGVSTKDLNTSVENEVLGVSHIFQLPRFHGTGSNLQA